MATMNISLPTRMKDFVEQQATSGHYSNASDYVRDLIRKDAEHKEKIAHIQAMVDVARNSGESAETMADIAARALKTIQADRG